MPLVDLVIIHGGQGSVQTAIAAGVPLIGFPLQGEQSFNLAMIERHGAGLALPLRSLKRGELRTDIERVLNEPSFTTSMRRLKELQDRHDGAVNAATILQELAQGAITR